jgi:hypothetical protein
MDVLPLITVATQVGQNHLRRGFRFASWPGDFVFVFVLF